MLPVESRDGNSRTVFFETSEFAKGRKSPNEDTGGGQSAVLASVTENLQQLLEEAFGNPDSWLGQFKHGNELLYNCGLPRLLEISDQDSKCDASGPEFKVALATAVMIEYGTQENASDELIMRFISAVMEKLEPFISSALQNRVADIVKTMSDLQSSSQDVSVAIQNYLKKRNKSASSTTAVVCTISQFQPIPLLHEKALKLEALERSLLLVQNGLSRATGLALCTSDTYTLSQRIAAAIPACSIMRTRSVVSNRNMVLEAQNAVWQLTRLGAGLQSIFVLVTKTEFSENPIYIAEWLASADLSGRIQLHTIKQILKPDWTGDLSESRIVLLPSVSASDFNTQTAALTATRSDRFVEQFRYRRRLARQCLETLTREHAWFFYVSDPRDRRFVGSSAIDPFPTTGVCLSKNISIEKACLLFNEQAVVGGAEPPFKSFERSENLFSAESLSEMSMRQDYGILNDMLQASFDAYGCFSSIHGKMKLIGNLSKEHVTRMSQRQLLTDVDQQNVSRIAQILSQDMIAPVACFGSPSIKEARFRISPASSDDERNALSAASANDMSDNELGNHDDDAPPTYTASRKEQVAKTLQSSAMTRYIQIDVVKKNEGSEVGSSTAVAVSYMMVLPEVEPDGRVSRIPVATYIHEHKDEGHFVYCTCGSFSAMARKLGKDYPSTKEVWYFPDKQMLYREDKVKEFCSHASIRDLKVSQLFGEQAESNYNVERWRQTSITIASGLKVLDRHRRSKVVHVKFAGDSFDAHSEKCFYSVLREDTSENVSSHAFVSRSSRRQRHDKRPDPEPQLQLHCLKCTSRLIHASSRRKHCIHIQSVHETIKISADKAGDGMGAAPVMSPGKKPRTRFWGEYNPTLVEQHDHHTGFIFHNATYTNRPHPLDYQWADNRLRFGHGISFSVANDRNKVLEKLELVGEDSSNAHYKVDQGRIIRGELPDICPTCSTARGSSEVRPMHVVLYMSDLAIVHTHVDYFICSHPGCNLCIHADGFADGFWFFSKHHAISNMLIWDFVTLQMEEHGRDLVSYHRHCQLTLQARMRSAAVKLFSLQTFIETYFTFISLLQISFNTGCLGCTSDALEAVPESKEHSHVQAFAALAPEGARDISCVGVDGLSSMFAGTHDFEKEGSQTIPEDGKDRAEAQVNDASDPTSSFLGSCRCFKKINFASRQFDRSPIKKDDDKSTQTKAAELRKSFLELGRLIKDSRKSNLYEVKEESPTKSLLASIGALLLEASPVSRFKLISVLGLAAVCAHPQLLAKEFGVDKAQLLLSYSGEFLGQLAASNSVLTLMKPGAIRASLAFCDAFEKAESDESAVHEARAREYLAALKSLCKTQLATPGLLAATLTTLLDFVCLGASQPPIQLQVNKAIVSALRYVAQRTDEVMEHHKLHFRPLSECDQEEIEEVRTKGFEFPVPVRRPGVDVSKKFTDDELGTRPPSALSNPVKDNGAHFFTKHGGRIRDIPVFEGEGDPGDCRKPDFQRNGRVGRGNNKLMAVFMFCACHGTYVGYTITRNEGRKDPWTILMSLKETFPHNISYDFACG